jgi:hypothetical protein
MLHVYDIGNQHQHIVQAVVGCSDSSTPQISAVIQTHARQADSALVGGRHRWNASGPTRLTNKIPVLQGGASGPNASADALTELLKSIEDLLLCVKLLTVQPQVLAAALRG